LASFITYIYGTMKGMKRVLGYRGIFVFLAIIVPGLYFGFFAKAAVIDEVNQKNSQIEEIQRQIDQFQREIDAVHSKTVTLQGEVAALNAKISQITLELRSLAISISKTNLEIQDTQSKINDAEEKILKNEVVLGQYLRIIYQNDQETLTTIIFKHDTLSDFFTDLNSVKTTQDDLKTTIKNIKELKDSLEAREQDLEDKKSDLEQQKALVEIDKQSLDKNKAQKDKLLKDTKGQESKFQDLVKQNQYKIQQIQQEIYYLRQNGVSVDDAIKYGNLAALSVGIRPAFLLAELNLESGLGQNVGKCNLTDTTSGYSRRVTTGQVSVRGMHPTRDLPIFLNITSGLGRDPLKTPISCWPGYGWGGAMGPAQFIPSTWMGYAEKVANIVGRAIADPWNIQDAFTAAAIKLAKDGATSKTRAGEMAASKAYFCGNPKSTASRCVNYAQKVQNLAADIERNL